MALDPSIALSVKPIQLANPLEQYMQVQQIQQAQNQSRLQDLMYGEKQQQIARSNNLLNLMKGLPQDATDDQRMNTLRGAGYFDEADKLDTSIQNRLKTKAGAQKDQAEAAKNYLTSTQQIAGQVMTAPTLENANAALNTMEALGKQLGFDVAGTIASERQTLAGLKTPEEIKQWAAGHAIQAKELLPKIDTRNLGGATETFSIDPVTGAVKVLNTARNTQSPDSAASNAQRERESLRTDARAREQIAAGKVPSGYRQGPDGTLVAIPGGPADTANKPLTEDQAKSTGWLVQAENAWKNMQAVGLGANGKPTDAAKPGRIETALSAALPSAAGEAAANSWRSANRQKFLQGASSLSEALLRAATGAGVNKDEAAQKVRELTPVWGDSDEVIKQKMDSIPLYIETLKVRSGPGAPKAANVLRSPSTVGVPDDIAALLQKHGGK